MTNFIRRTATVVNFSHQKRGFAVLENMPRSLNRAQWKFLYRQYRIVRRETLKASMDMVIYGCGIVEIGEHIPDGIRHIKTKETIAFNHQMETKT